MMTWLTLLGRSRDAFYATTIRPSRDDVRRDLLMLLIVVGKSMRTVCAFWCAKSKDLLCVRFSCERLLGSGSLHDGPVEYTVATHTSVGAHTFLLTILRHVLVAYCMLNRESIDFHGRGTKKKRIQENKEGKIIMGEIFQYR